MSVPLVDLVPSIRVALNVPGSTTGLFVFDDEGEWVDALANGFWYAKLRGCFAKYRVTDAKEIVYVPDVDDITNDLSREEQQVIVLFAALSAIEAQMLSLYTLQRSKAGPVETEKQRSATLLKALLDEKRKELAEVRDDLASQVSTTVAVIDTILGRYGDGGGSFPWVR